jgi:hypothetical protein
MPRARTRIFLLALVALACGSADARAQRRPPVGDYVNRVVVPLRDASGAPRFNLVVARVGDGAPVTTIADLQGTTLATLGAPPSAPSLPVLSPEPGSDEKADGPSQTDIRSLQLQVDNLRRKLNEAIERLNALSR